MFNTLSNYAAYVVSDKQINAQINLEIFQDVCLKPPNIIETDKLNVNVTQQKRITCLK